MKNVLFALGFLFFSQAAFAFVDCDALDGRYQEETGLFNFRIRSSTLQATGKVSYNGQVFYYRYYEPFYWDAHWNGCVTRTTFRVGGCAFPVLTYLRKKITSDAEYVTGTVTPTEIYAYSCQHLGNTDRKYTVLRQ